jgi:transposase
LFFCKGAESCRRWWASRRSTMTVGKMRGTRAIWGGRAQVRAVLYMCTLVATRRNPVLRAFYLRLRAAGKKPTIALTASMRKLLTTLNAVTVNGRPSFQLVPLEEEDDLIDRLIQDHPEFGKLLQRRLSERTVSVQAASRRLAPMRSAKRKARGG